MQGTIGFTGTLSGQIDDSGSGGTSNYNELTNKPSINSVPLVGNKTTEDLHLFSGEYDDLSDKPSINGITLSGNKTTADLGLFSGNYNDLTNKPILFSGDYNDLTNKPILFSGDYNDLTNKPTLFDGDYDSLTDRPTINNVVLTGNKTTSDLGLFSGNYNDLTNKPTLFDGDYDSLSSRPQINGNLLTGNKTTADLGLFSGNYNDLTNKPTLFSGDYNDLTNKPTIPEIDMAPSGAATEEMDDIEVDGTVYEVVDAAARGIIGDGQLDPGFTATNLTGAANELKSNLTDKGNWVELLTTNSAITTTATSYDLNDDFTKYKSLVLQLCRYDNVYDSMILSSSYFNTTHNGGRPFLLVTNASYQTEVYKNTTSKVYIKSIANMDNTYNVKIFGIK